MRGMQSRHRFLTRPTFRIAMCRYAVWQSVDRRSIKKVACRHLKVRCQSIDDLDGRVAGASFEVADIGPMDIHFECQPFLRQVSLVAKPTKICREAFANIHTLRSISCSQSVYRRSVTFRLTTCRAVRPCEVTDCLQRRTWPCIKRSYVSTS